MKYTTDNVRVSETIECIRRRPAMYVGGTDTVGFHYLFFEVINNVLNEFDEKFVSRLIVKINSDDTIKVADNGRGISVGKSPDQEDLSLLELYLTLNNIQKRKQPESRSLHHEFIGLNILNALSESLKVSVYQNGYRWSVECQQGNITQSLMKHEKTQKTGTEITYKPDQEIFQDLKFDGELISNRLRELAFLNAGLEIEFEDQRKNFSENFHSKNGLTDFVKFLNEDEQVLYDEPFEIYENLSELETEIHIVFQNIIANEGSVAGFVCDHHTKEGGTHILGFFKGLNQAISEYGRRHGLINGEPPSFDVCVFGVSAVVCYNVPNPNYESPSKSYLGNRKVIDLVCGVTEKHLSRYYLEHPEIAEQIVSRAVFHQSQRRMLNSQI
ncbi:ATP-binding protein [Rubinisphaera italica]|uniref:DNA topoisomerase (ATP-hydrolyzing) n=1 Tax=Rubinisphaera italica TaxID=2527969 RepID=A0A5C5XLN5_9PLAN|nr:ATP-binding protein [Rubinisphaera italica]TWT63361.1 DNA gyrase subunit B [Rubinisphaera italica]